MDCLNAKYVVIGRVVMKSPGVLIVDQTNTIGPVLTQSLIKENIQVIQATSLKQIIRACKSKKLNLIVWNLSTEEKDVTKWLPLLKHRFPEIALCVTSALEEQHNLLINHPDLANTVRCFRKPFKLQEIVNTIKQKLIQPVNRPKTPTVLIVDDEPDTCDIISQYLTRLNFRVIQASNGKQGLEKCQDNSIDVVITDLCMPEMDGFECLAKLRVKYPELLTYVITAGGNLNKTRTIQESKALGANRVFYKPLSLAELHQVIEEDFAGLFL